MIKCPKFPSFFFATPLLGYRNNVGYHQNSMLNHSNNNTTDDMFMLSSPQQQPQVDYSRQSNGGGLVTGYGGGGNHSNSSHSNSNYSAYPSSTTARPNSTSTNRMYFTEEFLDDNNEPSKNSGEYKHESTVNDSNSSPYYGKYLFIKCYIHARNTYTLYI